MRLVPFSLAGRDKQGNPVECGTIILVNPEHVRRVMPVLVVSTDAGLPVGGVTQLTYSDGATELVSGTVKDVRNALQA